jgi:hypothetical protein
VLRRIAYNVDDLDIGTIELGRVVTKVTRQRKTMREVPVDQEALSAIKAHIDPDETVLWVGRPAALAYALKSGGLLTVMGIAGTAMMISLALDMFEFSRPPKPYGAAFMRLRTLRTSLASSGNGSSAQIPKRRRRAFSAGSWRRSCTGR